MFQVLGSIECQAPDKERHGETDSAKGCDACFQTGYRGRRGIFEIMTLDDELKTLILQTHDSNLIRKTAVSKQMTSLRQDGIQTLLGGTTTIEEIIRVTQL